MNRINAIKIQACNIAYTFLSFTFIKFLIQEAKYLKALNTFDFY